MKVVLLRDVARIGKRHEVKEVPAGHAQNFLIPRQLALPATPENLKKVERLMAHTQAGQEKQLTDFKTALTALAAAPLTITVEANAQGHLFKGIHAEDIAEAAQSAGHGILPAMVTLEHPLKSTGEHTVTLTCGSVTETVTVVVSAK